MRRELRRLFRLPSLRNEEDVPMAERKQEHTTHLLGAAVVVKTHPRIELRGRLDSLNAAIIRVQIQAREAGCAQLEEELEEVRNKVGELLACEVRDVPCSELSLWGLTDEEIHARSHFPEHTYGIGHILPHPDMGRWAAELNQLRTLVREVELCACRSFATENGMERPDIIKVLNRLSSAFYILTYRYLPEGYDRTIHFAKT